jgi:hypothetical protein
MPRQPHHPPTAKQLNRLISLTRELRRLSGMSDYQPELPDTRERAQRLIAKLDKRRAELRAEAAR